MSCIIIHITSLKLPHGSHHRYVKGSTSEFKCCCLLDDYIWGVWGCEGEPPVQSNIENRLLVATRVLVADLGHKVVNLEVVTLLMRGLWSCDVARDQDEQALWLLSPISHRRNLNTELSKDIYMFFHCLLYFHYIFSFSSKTLS